MSHTLGHWQVKIIATYYYLCMARRESRETRSRIMSSIKSSGTGIEKAIAKILVDLNLEFEEHPHDIFGKPDFVMRSSKIAIFCDGDFWHGFNMKTNPRLDIKNNREFWIRKIRFNIIRDSKVNKTLASSGWRVIRLWEHDIRDEPNKCRETILATVGDSE